MLDFCASVAQFLFAILFSFSLDCSLYFFTDIQYYLRAYHFFHVQFSYSPWHKLEMCFNCSGIFLHSFTAQCFLSWHDWRIRTGDQTVHIWFTGDQTVNVWLYILRIIRVKYSCIIPCSPTWWECLLETDVWLYSYVSLHLRLERGSFTNSSFVLDMKLLVYGKFPQICSACCCYHVLNM
jgi:hypothetical protein